MLFSHSDTKYTHNKCVHSHEHNEKCLNKLYKLKNTLIAPLSILLIMHNETFLAYPSITVILKIVARVPAMGPGYSSASDYP